MYSSLKRLFSFLVTLSLCAAIAIPTHAQNLTVQATEISGISLVSDSSGFSSLKYLFNNKFWETQKTEDTAYLTLEHSEGIGSLYLSFMYPYGAYTVTNNDSGDTYTAGTDLFIHEFIDLTGIFGSAPSSVTVSFDNGPAHLHELDAFTEGEVPADIEKWNHPQEGNVDLILFATHSDDDQLFFAGLLPYYAIDRDYQVLVVYLTDHYNTAPGRVHEVLRGLWAVGVRNYPILGHFEDFGDATTAEEAFQNFAKYGHSREDLTGFVVEQLRRYQPMVVVGHDLKGEYGHAQHKAYAQLLVDAVSVSNNPEQYPETAAKYGTWDVPKTYIHLYSENQIVMDWDQPMDDFNGMTPYQVSKKLGFPFHVSQQKGWSWYYEGKNTAASIKKYSPCNYGLYRSTIGPDVEKNDMFENLRARSEQIPPTPETLPPETQAPTQIPTAPDVSLPTEPKQDEASLPAPPAETQPVPVYPVPEPSVSVPEVPTLWIVLEITLVIALLLLLIMKRKTKR